MSTVVVTGAGGLVGSTVARHFAHLGFHVVGIDNNMRSQFFGIDGSVAPNIQRLRDQLGGNYTHRTIDVEDYGPLDRLIGELGRAVELVVHAAAQPAHDWADEHPLTDFRINALGTVNMLETARRHCLDATFVHFSTIKVYGPHPNELPLGEGRTRFDLPPVHRYYNGIDETMSIDGGPLRGGSQGWGPHSMFGASKTAADLMVQEYGHSYGMKTVVLRPSCLTGGVHAAAEAHGFLAYLMRCAMEGRPYRIFGYRGRQVRDQLHVNDVATAVDAIRMDPPTPGSVFNLGGGRPRAISILEAVGLVERFVGQVIEVEQIEEPRRGDHRWWITDSSAFENRYAWKPVMGINDMIEEIYQVNFDRWRRK